MLKQSQKLIKTEEVLQEFKKEHVQLSQWAERKPNRKILEELVFAKDESNKNLKRMKSAVAVSKSKECILFQKDEQIDAMKQELLQLKYQLAEEVGTNIVQFMSNHVSFRITYTHKAFLLFL